MKVAGQKVVRFSTDPITDVLLKKYLTESLKVDSNDSYKKFIEKFDNELSSSINESKSHLTLYNNIHLVRKFINEKDFCIINYRFWTSPNNTSTSNNSCSM